MQFVNQSSRPSREVLALVKMGARSVGVDLDAVKIIVTDGRAGSSGRAWAGVPFEHRDGTSKWMVLLRIGPDTSYPADNLRWKKRWLPAGTTRADAEKTLKRIRKDFMAHLDEYSEYVWVREDHGTNRVYRQQSRYTIQMYVPYGGMRSVIYREENWREGVVGIAAHELTHIDQFRHNRRPTEDECERAAARAIKEYRAGLLDTRVAAKRAK